MLERLEWGNFYGTMAELRAGRPGAGRRSRRRLAGVRTAPRAEAPGARPHPGAGEGADRRRQLRDRAPAARREEARPREAPRAPSATAARRRSSAQIAADQARYDRLAARLSRLRDRFQAETLVMRTGERRDQGDARRHGGARHPAERHGVASPSCASTARGRASSSAAIRASRTPRGGSSRPSSAP